MLLVAGEDLNSPSTLITYKLGRAARHRSVKVPTSDNVAGYSGGFIMGPDIKTGTQLWRVSVTGTVTKLKALPKPAHNGPPYEVTAVSPDGRVFAAELGDHTDGCGVGPPSRIYCAQHRPGHSSGILPAGAARGGGRKSSSSIPSDTLDATMIDCTRTGHDAFRGAMGVPQGVLTGDKKGASGWPLRQAAISLTRPVTSKLGGTEAPIPGRGRLWGRSL